MSKTNSTLTADRLRDFIAYDPLTGLVSRKLANTNKLKSMVGVWQQGSITSCGYRSIRIDRIPLQVHRLAWLYMTGEWPSGQIDHKNGIRSDNRFVNLRDVTPSENQLNLSKVNHKSASGVRGAQWNKRLGKFQSQIEVGGARIYLGLFDTADEAGAAYQRTREQYGIESLRE